MTSKGTYKHLKYYFNNVLEIQLHACLKHNLSVKKKKKKIHHGQRATMDFTQCLVPAVCWVSKLTLIYTNSNDLKQ